MKKAFYKLALISTCAVLSMGLAGCNEEAQARAAQMRATPEVTALADVDGCQVKYVDRGYANDSFFMARCGNTTTTTRNYTEPQGKTTVFRRSTVIAQELEAAQAEEAREAAREAALKKLSPDETKALGLSR